MSGTLTEPVKKSVIFEPLSDLVLSLVTFCMLVIIKIVDVPYLRIHSYLDLTTRTLIVNKFNS